MNTSINKLPEFLKFEKLRNDKRIPAFLVCLLIATALWFLNALGKDYTTTVSYPVRYVNAPNKQFLANDPPSKLDLKVDAHGFTLLRHKLSLTFSPIILNLTNITKNLHSENGIYMVTSSELMRRVQSQISNELSIQEIEPEVIQIVLDSLRTRSVPVKPNVELEFMPQYSLQNPVRVIPAEVKITGPSFVIDSIVQLETKKGTFKGLETSIETLIDVIHPDRTSLTPDRVKLKIEVEKFTEKELKVPVRIENKPDSVSMKIFPSEVKVTCLVGLSEYEEVTADDFKAVVDYNTVSNNSRNLHVTVEQKSTYIQFIRCTPDAVEYLIETN
jgi:hypothetical protein